ncbi:cytochrome P450 [Pendulispora rubella]|uniref:Cytochrome P450 n=1 Tax=Pendulispora rubella TaxID=2741070 RepID=A0ABZ2KXA1_9BACT
MTDTVVPRAPGGIPVFGHALSLALRPLQFVQSLRAHGDMVKVALGPIPVWVVNSPALIHRILVTDASHFCKGRLFDKAREVVGNGLALSDGPFHLAQRRLVQPAFHRERLASYVDIMREQTMAMTDGWRPGRTMAIDEQFNELALAIVSRALFRSEVGREAVERVLRALPVATEGMVARTLLPVDLLERLPTRRNRRFQEAVVELRSVIDGVVSAYRVAKLDHDDVLSMLLAARDAQTGQAMSPEQIRAEVMTIMLAGTETAGSTLGWLFYELARNPSIGSAVGSEIEGVLEGRPITANDLPRLPYTRRVLNETLRLHAPNWILMRRVAHTVDLGGVRLAPGAEVMFSIYALHRDPALYAEPSRFDPDRWLPERNAPRDAYIPFGGGNRRCIGDQFALMEITTAVATIVGRWRLRLKPGCHVRERALAALRPDKLPMIAERRA